MAQKEIFSTESFIQEDIYRMDNYQLDKTECYAYVGDPEDAPITALYVYQPVEAYYSLSAGDKITIVDAVDAPLKSFTIYGETEYRPLSTNPRVWTISSGVGSYHDNIICKDFRNVGQSIPIERSLNSTPSQEYFDYYKDGYVYYKTKRVRVEGKAWDWREEPGYYIEGCSVFSASLPDALSPCNDIGGTHWQGAPDLTRDRDAIIKDGRLYVVFSRRSLESFINSCDLIEMEMVYPLRNVHRIPIYNFQLYTHLGDSVIQNDGDGKMLIVYRTLPNARVWKRQEDGTFKEIQRD